MSDFLDSKIRLDYLRVGNNKSNLVHKEEMTSKESEMQGKQTVAMLQEKKCEKYNKKKPNKAFDRTRKLRQ